MLRICYGGK